MNFPIVGIGASAGGLEALEVFFRFLPIDTGFGYIVLLHLDPTQKGMMPELLQRFTKMQVIAAENGALILADHVYVLPSNKSMLVENRTLYLIETEKKRGLRLPIDLFLKSLAKDQKSNCAGIILSGMGADGSEGMLSIKNNGGSVFVQDPKSSKFDDMPKNAIASLTELKIDLIASPELIASNLFQILKSDRISNKTSIDSLEYISPLKKIQSILMTVTGNDFSSYKSNTMIRRIERRMSVHYIKNMDDYVNFIKKNSGELELLFKELLIGVTHFFRDHLVWEKLKSNIIPDLFAKAKSGDTIRSWIVGCSTGEEAYSLAIIFTEVLENLVDKKQLNFQIFATDIDEDAITKARQGLFSEGISKDISTERLERFFNRVENGYRVTQRLREMVVFAPHNIIKDPPFTKLNIVSCRNIMIYLENVLQKKMLTLFHYCLIQGGYLLLGSAETIGEQNASNYSTIDTKLHIYRKDNNFRKNDILDFPTSFINKKKDIMPILKTQKNTPNIQALTEQLILQKFAPASVLTNESGDILFITGNTGNYLEPAAGKASLNLFIMARLGIRHEISIAFRKAKDSYNVMHLKNLKVEANSMLHLVDVIIQKIEHPEPLRDLFLVVFKNVPTLIPKQENKTKDIIKNPNSDQFLLETELQRVKEELQLTIEEMQSSQEELKSSNEELQSTNEELQSTNEELTSSKEEMQSLNEELQSVNSELQIKVDDYIAITNDFKNLLDSTDIATLFLDMELRIRRFTKQVGAIFNLIPTDIGRPFTDIVNKLDYPTISTDARSVIENLVFIEKTIPSKDGRWLTVKIMPYRTIDNKIIGLVLTFSDITKMKELEFTLRQTNENLDLNLKAVEVLLQEKELILKEVHHRIKNNMSVIFSLLSLQADAQKDDSIKNIILDAANRVQSMMLLYDKLYRSSNPISIQIKEYLPTLIDEIVNAFSTKEKISIKTNIVSLELTPKILTPLGIILNELITNSMKYAFAGIKQPEIKLDVSINENTLRFNYQDNGIGINPSSPNKNSTGFGLQLISILVQQIKGNLLIVQEDGMKFIIEFPFKNPSLINNKSST
jgi:two-component system CheB/CheR fusion protein